MEKSHTDYHQQAPYFAKLKNYSPTCGTDYLAVRDLPKLIKSVEPHTQVLDYGCGSGLATRFLRSQLPESHVIGADINSSMLTQAQNADPDGDYRLITNKHAPAEYIPVGSCDVISTTFVLHANPSLDDVTDFLTNCHTLLRPGGKLLIGSPDSAMGKGDWTTVEILYPNKVAIEEQSSFIVRLLPSKAIVAGIYWPATLIESLLADIGFTNIKIAFPVAHQDDTYPWKDELNIAPYYLLSCDKPA